MELNLYLLGVFTLSVDSFCPYSIDIDLICANAPIWLHIFNKSSVFGCIFHMHQVGVWLFGFIASRNLNCCYEYVICFSSIKIWQTQQKPWNVFNMFYKLMEGKHCLPVTSHLWCQKLTLKFSYAWFWLRCSLLIILLYIYLILLMPSWIDLLEPTICVAYCSMGWGSTGMFYELLIIYERVHYGFNVIIWVLMILWTILDPWGYMVVGDGESWGGNKLSREKGN